jgi:hypothetical protein
MNRDPLLVRLLLACYPASWRQRYGDEYADLMTSSFHATGRGRRVGQVSDILRGALDARIHSKGRGMADRSTPMTAAVWATGLFTIAVCGLAKMTDDPALIAAHNQHAAVNWSFALVPVTAGIAVIALIVAALPAGLAMLRKPEWRSLGLLIIPIAACAAWYAGVRLALHFAGGRGAHAGVNLTAAVSVTASAVIVVGLIAWTAAAVLRRVPAGLPPRGRSAALAVLALGMAAETAACLAWGISVHDTDPAGYHARTDGLYATSFLPSWITISALMAAATALAAWASLRDRGGAARIQVSRP